MRFLINKWNSLTDLGKDFILTVGIILGFVPILALSTFVHVNIFGVPPSNVEITAFMGGAYFGFVLLHIVQMYTTDDFKKDRLGSWQKAYAHFVALFTLPLVLQGVLDHPYESDNVNILTSMGLSTYDLFFFLSFFVTMYLIWMFSYLIISIVHEIAQKKEKENLSSVS